jgi:thioesterase domain-containing protein
VGEAHRWAHWSYRPQAYLHPIEFFIVTDSENRAGTDSLGWARWTNGSLRIHRLPGHHRSMLKPPVVEELAARLQACIDRATDN